MYIKQIAIQGFKSYKNQTVTEPFSPHHNVVVGRNGSGKSNFFAAVRFVLSDAYTNMSREERQALLHEGSGPATMSAFVEIVFDNSDNRFPTGKDETVIRRTIGLKKDEYLLDGKSALKTDIMNLLESAGFSRSNPYYIVPQGRVTTLTHAKDGERLALLKEVAGTRVYETRRRESLKIMEETDLKKKKIKELLEFIMERLSELETEKQELQEFQELDSDRRCLEYAIYSREQEEVLGKLEELDEERREKIIKTSKRQEEYATLERTMKELEMELKNLKQTYQALGLSREQTVRDLEEQIRNRTQVEASVNDALKDLEVGQGDESLIREEIAQLRASVKSCQSRLAEVTSKHAESAARLAQTRDQFDTIDFERNALLQRQGHASQFSSKNDRDRWLRDEIEKLEETLAKQQEQLTSLESTRSEVDGQIKSLRHGISESREAEDKDKAEVDELTAKEVTLVNQRDEKTTRRKELWREEAELESRIRELKDGVAHCERTLFGTMDADTSSGLQALRKLVEEYQIDGVFGAVYELFEVDEVYNAVVETIAGGSMFHVIVDTDDTATKVVELLSRQRAGRLTFMPLNRLHPLAVTYPSSSEAVPIIEKLTFNPDLDKAFRHIFGRAIVCPDIETASRFSRSHQLIGVTLDGDRVDRRGAITGGYIDANNSRIEAARSLQELATKLTSKEDKLAKVRRKLTKLDQEITGILGEIQLTTVALHQKAASRSASKANLASVAKEEANLRARLISINKSRESLSEEVRATESQLKAYRQELGSLFEPTLTDAERGRLLALTRQVDELQEELINLSSACTELETEKNMLEDELESNLRVRLDKLESHLEAILGSESEGRVTLQRRELASYDDSISHLRASIKDLDVEMEGVQRQIDQAEKRLESAQNQQQSDSAELDKDAKSVDWYLSQRNLLTQKKEECVRNICDLGVLPEEAFQKYTGKSPQKLLKRLHKVNSKLKKYSHVNKKAFEQYTNFTQQRDDLLARERELEESAEAIHSLIDALDQQKDETIERTFKQVAKYFSEVFGKLVPSGWGKLVMQRQIDRGNEDELYDNDENNDSVENYIGVAIKVSFTGKERDGLRVQQLSGGQKSLVALALIFAIQRCDPAPFYLFDEIDANLDAVYRTAVSNMIHELSENCQFITTTFRPEMLANADQFYGVTYDSKVSQITRISKESALEFVEQSQPN